ncbi:hypothetical protein FRC0276_01874 [Corynebacterium diphtheriae]|nr:hypothetical protein FRC0276_01874 [Corynebacterium diphtheriae]
MVLSPAGLSTIFFYVELCGANRGTGYLHRDESGKFVTSIFYLLNRIILKISSEVDHIV